MADVKKPLVKQTRLMNAGDGAAFRTDLAKKVYESTFELERSLKATQKTLPPFSTECQTLRERLRKAYEDVIFLDFNFAHEQDVENLLWMKVHHKTIEAYRSRISKFKTTNGKQKPVEYRKLLHNFTNFTKDAAKYYRAFIQRLIVHFSITELHHLLQTFHMDIPAADQAVHHYSKELTELVVRSCHASLIYLGDLSRYRELQAASKNGQKNWGPALGYYQYARRLIPDAGKPMNQLAVVAIYTEDVLSSTYFFLRAVCAAEEFPTARDNLALGFRKVATRPNALAASATELYIQLIASIYTKEKLSRHEKEQASLLQSLQKAIVQRDVTAEVLTKLLTINIGTNYALARGSGRDHAQAVDQNRSRLVNDLLIAVVGMHLDVFSAELTATSETTDMSLQITPVMRRILPALRISSRWLQLNLVDARSLWTKYIACMTLCGSKFPRNVLPALPYPLAEDIDLRGFQPLQGGLSKSSLDDSQESSHPNEEMLGRVSELLADAATLAQRIDQELSQAGSPDKQPSVSRQSPRLARPDNRVPATSDSHKLSEVTIAKLARLEKEESESHASEPSMAFSLNQMVDSLVGHAGEEEEFVFKGRRKQ